MIKDINGHSYLGKKRFLYIPGSENQKIYKHFFNIEICQDHDKLEVKPFSRFLIVQSASTNIRGDLETLYRGICVHADIEAEKSSVYYIEPEQEVFSLSLKMKGVENNSTNNNFKLCLVGGGNFSIKEINYLRDLDINMNNITRIDANDYELENLYQNASLFVFPKSSIPSG